MGYVTYLLVLCVLTVINAQKYWWDTGKPFERSTEPAPFIPPKEMSTSKINYGRITQRSCQCTRPEYCRDYYDPRNPMDSRCDIDGDMCCERLRFAEPILENTEDEISVNTGGNKVDSEDIGYDSSEEYTEDEQVVQSPTTNPPPKKSSPQVIDLGALEESTQPTRVKWACGKPHYQLDEKFADVDYNAKFTEFPWTLALFEEIQLGADLSPSIRCAASLIDGMLAVTAAHCVKQLKRENIIIRAGEWDLNNQDETLAHQDRRVKQVIVHEEYDPINLDNDIALLFLDKAFEEARHIATICLPTENEKITSPCLATGWGMRTNQVSSSSQQIMKKVELNFEFLSSCQKKLRETDLGPTFALPRSVICASKIKKGGDTGYGDGGDPFFCKSPEAERFILVGIASWGKLSYPDAPGVYTSVYKQIDWIQKKRELLIQMLM